MALIDIKDDFAFFVCKIWHSIHQDLQLYIKMMNIHNCAGILEQSMGARKRVRIGLSYRPARVC
jgi:hypothetical protein